MQVLNYQEVIEPVTFQRNHVADVRVTLSPEAIMELLSRNSLDTHTEIANILGMELVDKFMAARREFLKK